MTNRFIVLDVRPQVDILFNYHRYFNTKHGNPQLRPASQRRAYALIAHLVSEIVEGYSAIKVNTDWSAHIAGTLHGVKPEQCTAEMLNVAKEFLDDPLLIGILTDLDRQVATHINRRTWIEWSIITVSGLIALAEGKDHRIAEWERLTDYHNDDDYAVLALNCVNPVEYLYNEIIKYIGKRHPVDRDGNVMVITGILPRRVLEEQIDALFLSTIVMLYPQIELDRMCPRLNDDVFLACGLACLNEFKHNYVANIITAFGLAYFSNHLDRNKRYTLEYSSAKILAIYEKREENKTDKEMHELVQSLLAGDYLPEDQRVIAERWIFENQY
jgi:hypothetical protein